MLQLPTTSKKFSRLEMADIARGAKVEVKAKPAKTKVDPIIRLIQRADAAMDAYVLACNDVFLVKETLKGRDFYGAIYEPPAILSFDAWRPPFHFNNLWHFEVETKKRQPARLRELVRLHRLELKKLRPGHGAAHVELDLRKRIAAAEQQLKLIKELAPQMQRAFKKEIARVNRVQKAVKLPSKLKARQIARERVRQLTNDIGQTSPTTSEGAVALLKYVGDRLFPDRVGYFLDEAGGLPPSFPGNFYELLQRVHRKLVG